MRCEGGGLLRLVVVQVDRTGAVCIGQAVGIDSAVLRIVSEGLTVSAVLCRRGSFRSGAVKPLPFRRDSSVFAAVIFSGVIQSALIPSAVVPNRSGVIFSGGLVSVRRGRSFPDRSGHYSGGMLPAV